MPNSQLLKHSGETLVIDNAALPFISHNELKLEGPDNKNLHQGERPERALHGPRQDRAVRLRGRGRDGADQQRGDGPRRLLLFVDVGERTREATSSTRWSPAR